MSSIDFEYFFTAETRHMDSVRLSEDYHWDRALKQILTRAYRPRRPKSRLPLSSPSSKAVSDPTRPMIPSPLYSALVPHPFLATRTPKPKVLVAQVVTTEGHGALILAIDAPRGAS